MRSVADAEACLAAFGARRVVGVDGLGSMQEDIWRDELNKPSLGGNGTVVIGQYQPVIPEDDRGLPDALRYVAWVISPASEEPSDPVAAVEMGDPATVVMYVERPKPGILRQARRCMSEIGAAEPQGAVDQESSLAVCLERAGAESAVTASDLKFFIGAEGPDGSADSGFIYDRQINAMVQIWRQGGRRSGQSPQWAVWAADPFPGDARAVFDLLEERPPRSFVMFMTDPSLRELEKAGRCIAEVQARERELRIARKAEKGRP